eukprot:1195693-Prorocentrum_minimum.AAC.7
MDKSFHLVECQISGPKCNESEGRQGARKEGSRQGSRQGGSGSDFKLASMIHGEGEFCDAKGKLHKGVFYNNSGPGLTF